MLLDLEGLGKLSKARSKSLVSGDGIFAVYSTVVDLVLAGLALLKNSRNNALTNNSLSKVVNNYSSRCEKPLDIQLVDKLDASNIFASGNTGSLITTLGSEGTNTISTEREEDVVINKDLGIPAFCGV
ncbi:hypothetical protein HG530_014169 [Fusarium avenaceum]|nr:hypothetical protein HG530_014169 [Fusarium avenaceum]